MTALKPWLMNSRYRIWKVTISNFSQRYYPNFNLATYLLVSAKTGENVNEAFMKLVLEVKHRLIDKAT